MSKIISGKAWALKHEQALQQKIAELNKKPVLVSFLVGDDPGSILYTHIKHQKAQELGIDFRVERFSFPPGGWQPEWEDVCRRIQELNQEREVDGIMVQLPLPLEFLAQHSSQELIELINPQKDVDGLLPNSPYLAATVRGIISLINDEDISLEDKVVVVVGSKGEVGSRLMKTLDGKVKQLIGIDQETKDLSSITRQADLLITSTGKHHLIQPEMIKQGAILFDVGSEKLESGEVVGDIDPSCYQKSSLYTPVPGGIGPMTVISLMENVVEATDKEIQDS